jgi:hypothetical protein
MLKNGGQYGILAKGYKESPMKTDYSKKNVVIKVDIHI